MDEILDALAEQHAELSRLLAPLDEAGWTAPSRCEGWDVADVVLHLAQTDQLAVGSATGRFAEVAAGLAGSSNGPVASVDEGVERMVARERGQDHAALRDRWESGTRELRRVLGDADPHARVEWVAGQLSVRTLTTTRLAETWIHTGDVADALGVTPEAGERLRHIARLAWRTVPYAFAREGRELSGPVAFELTGPGGDEWTFTPDEEPATVVRGDALELCLVAGRRADPAATGLEAEGPDAEAVLELVRTYA